MRKTASTVASTTDISKFPILGTFEGECADATITNNNGLDITEEVWEHVFNSDIFKQGIELGWYIGFLGHPESPDCMDYRNACIVMTEGHIDDSGKIYGKFNLIDTPVGRIVKTFIDAGVTFGISVRGAGDIVNNSVTPGSFDFRGFDLVSFPAYPEAIPDFKEIAASTDVKKQSQYKSICAAVESNLADISSIPALEILQSQFAPQSEQFEMIADRKDELLSDDTDLIGTQIKALTIAYSQLLQDYQELQIKYEDAKAQTLMLSVQCGRKLTAMQRIVANQQRMVDDKVQQVYVSKRAIQSKYNKLKTAYDDLSAQYDSRIESSRRLQSRYRSAVDASTQLEGEVKSANLKYSQKVDTYKRQLAEKDRTISELQHELDETVRQSKVTSSQTSNLDEKVKSITAKLDQTTRRLKEYQSAYASLYASAVGVDPENISITASTDVSTLRQQIGSNSQVHSGTSGMSDDPIPSDIIDGFDDLITL